MTLHRLTDVTIGVPDVAATAAYYRDFGLEHLGDAAFGTRDGGRQLQLAPSPVRRLLGVGIGADDQDDLDRAVTRLRALEVPCSREPGVLRAVEPVTGAVAEVRVTPRLAVDPLPPTPYNGPGRVERRGRAPGVVRQGRVRPRKLGHVVIGTTDLDATARFFTDGLGFKVSDRIGDKGVFMRCSDDHHNVLALSAPVSFLHHTSWQVDDVDEIGRGATAMLEGHPERHVWGLGRHHAGSNFFWYLKDPAGNFSEYYSDMDCIPEDEIWHPEVFHGAQGLYNWGPPPPPSFLAPEDLAELMTGQHTARR